MRWPGGIARGGGVTTLGAIAFLGLPAAGAVCFGEGASLAFFLGLLFPSVVCLLPIAIKGGGRTRNLKQRTRQKRSQSLRKERNRSVQQRIRGFSQDHSV